MEEHTVTVMFGDGVEVIEGADVLQAEPGTVFLLPCKLRRVGEWRYFLLPAGTRAGLMALEVKLVKREG